jgi:ribonuclease P protein subunit RPR2
MKKEKTLNTKQKLALERIYRLFELAEEMQKEGKEKYSKRYLQLAKRIGEKLSVTIPKELKKKFCRKCYSMKVEEKKEKPFLIIKCTECKKEKKYSLEEKKYSLEEKK